jgi:hypothetical protein
VAQSDVRDFACQGAEHQLRRSLERDVDVYPCPTCGLVQPDMVARTKVPGHAIITVFMLALLPCVILPAVYHGITLHIAGLVCAGAAGVGALLHLLVAYRNPNRNRDANRERAKAEIERHRVEMVERGSMTDVSPPPRNLTVAHAVALLATAAGAVLFLGPELVRRSTDLPVNSDLTPFVAGPRDEVRIDFPKDHDLHSVGQRWRATATAKLLNAAEVGAPEELAASSSMQDWCDGFTVHAGTEHACPDLWARVQLPDGDGVAGKTLRLQVSLDLVYPSDCGQSGLSPTYQNRAARVTREFTVRVAEAEDKAVYESAWWLAVVGGPLGILGGGAVLVWLALALRSRARPTQVEWRQV